MRKSLLGALALLGLGCSGPDISKFEGTWRAIDGRGTNSCHGDWTLSTFNIAMRLREGEDSDLEWIDIDEKGQRIGDCIYRYSVEGEVATMDGRQSCVRTDVGAYIKVGWTFARSSLTLVDGRMREEGEAVFESVLFDGTTETCADTYTYEWERF
ncbi:hypothetical protein WMF11_43490 [Sorangium sp. So ce295]|jgi:hypothetical protein|uniref:hypothetical protein n=1 Tax=Sorangium sp. So ce295 TaxID=3133295 RepID=UPI003F5DAC88